MMLHSTSSRPAAGDHGARFEQLVADGGHDSNPLMAEYRLLYGEYCALSRRVKLLDREKNGLKTQLSEMDRSLELATRVDPMTGLANRRDIMEKMERELSRSERHGRTFSIMLVDLDDFNKVNEKYGFNDGDDVLVEVSRVLMGCARSEDVCARWGGEVFLFLLPETNVEGALILARKVLDSISMTEFKVNRPGIRITASIGLCEFKAGETIHDCIARTDQALSHAKQGGKDRFAVAA